MESWMLEHDNGQRIDLLSDQFRKRFGFGLSHGQVNLFRASHGTQKRKRHGGGKHRVPVGTEREGKDGYIVIKVREEAKVPMSKDNWKLKHVWVYEQAHGSVPEGHMVYFADGNRRNFATDNLVAVPRRLVGILNHPERPKWHDRESLLACIALAELDCKVRETEMSRPRTCGVCGRTFVPDEKQRQQPYPAQTCRECISAGHRHNGNRKYRRKYDYDEIYRLHMLGLRNKEISERVGCPPSMVSHILGKVLGRGQGKGVAR